MKKIFSLLIALILILSFAVPAFAANLPDLEVDLNADNNTVNVGEEIKVTLSFNNASEYPYGLAAFCAYLTYDSTILKVKSIEVAAPRSSVRHNSMSGELRSIYTFASAQKEPGFNTDGAFYTVVFETLAAGGSDVAVTFDTMMVTDYDTEELNFQVAFNSPSIRINVKGDTAPDSSTPSQGGATSSNTTSQNAPINSQNAPTNDKFQDVGDSGNDTITDVFGDNNEIIEQTESKAPNNTTSSNTTSAGKEDVNQSSTNGLPNFFWYGLIAFSVLVVVAVVVFIVVKSKNK